MSTNKKRKTTTTIINNVNNIYDFKIDDLVKFSKIISQLFRWFGASSNGLECFLRDLQILKKYKLKDEYENEENINFSNDFVNIYFESQKSENENERKLFSAIENTWIQLSKEQIIEDEIAKRNELIRQIEHLKKQILEKEETLKNLKK